MRHHHSTLSPFSSSFSETWKNTQIYDNHNFDTLLLLAKLWNFPPDMNELTFPTLSNFHSCPISINQVSYQYSSLSFPTRIPSRSHSRRYQCSSWCFFTWSPTLIPIVLIISQRFCKPTNHLLLQLSTNVSWRQNQLINSGPIHNVVLHITLDFCLLELNREAAIWLIRHIKHMQKCIFLSVESRSSSWILVLWAP